MVGGKADKMRVQVQGRQEWVTKSRKGCNVGDRKRNSWGCSTRGMRSHLTASTTIVAVK